MVFDCNPEYVTFLFEAEPEIARPAETSVPFKVT